MKKKRNRSLYVMSISLTLLITTFFGTKSLNNYFLKNNEDDYINQPNPTPIEEIQPVITDLLLSFVGDCTIGSDDNFGYVRTFNEVFDNNYNNGDYSYFFRGVHDILSNDDLTIANLETTFTTATKKAVKQFRFKGDPSYVNILEAGSVEVVNLANNHTYDYLEKGYQDTIDTLDNSNVSYYGRDLMLIKEVKGIKIGFGGLTYSDKNEDKYARVDEMVKYFNENEVDIKIITFHWGIERALKFNATQEGLGTYAIDQGVDLVIGHHPHVLQGIQEYKDSYIVYSLANFVFGGNKNPKDKDSMIYQHRFTFEDGKLISEEPIITPVSVSSKTYVNDYQPTILEGTEKERVMGKILKYSKDFTYPIKKEETIE
ncbi:MAG: CapA family protein [Bacilli bacterium]|nr:CapA family protein [Bacilli bacterium]